MYILQAAVFKTLEMYHEIALYLSLNANGALRRYDFLGTMGTMDRLICGYTCPGKMYNINMFLFLSNY